MATPLVECVPNFSEGRNAATIEALRLALTSVPGVRLLDVQSDAAHNRSVFTFVAPPDPSVEAALAAMCVATERIDLSRHTGTNGTPNARLPSSRSPSTCTPRRPR